MGLRWGTKKGKGISYNSMELHSPHKGGEHNIWHWQKNKWSYYNKKYTVSHKKAKRWNINGRRL